VNRNIAEILSQKLSFTSFHCMARRTSETGVNRLQF